MGETILVVIAVLAALAIAGRRLTSSGSNFPEPLETPAELPESPELTGPASRDTTES